MLLFLAGGASSCARAAPWSDGLGVGRAAPEFTLDALEGGQVSLSDLQGQVVLINLWATWCPPCKSEIPVLQAAYEAHKEQGLVVLGVAIGESADVVRPFVQQLGVTYPVVLDRDKVLLGKLRVVGLPMTVVVDRDGVIRARHSGELSRSQLEQLLRPVLSQQ